MVDGHNCRPCRPCPPLPELAVVGGPGPDPKPLIRPGRPNRLVLDVDLPWSVLAPAAGSASPFHP
eukprot:3714641-Heterocapsa_arctica.AAC.1